MSAWRSGESLSAGEKLRKGSEIFLRSFDTFTGVHALPSLHRQVLSFGRGLKCDSVRNLPFGEKYGRGKQSIQ
jgi:hypothetical protein